MIKSFFLLLIAVFLFLGSAVADAVAATSILAVIDQQAYGLNVCDKQTVYDLRGTVPLQKVKGGFLISTAPEYIAGDGGIVFLRTKQAVPENARLEGTVACDGEYRYVGLDGFDKVVPAFQAR